MRELVCKYCGVPRGESNANGLCISPQTFGYSQHYWIFAKKEAKP
jgi:hypothetical protein